jgi:hypothetical protein
MRGMAGAAFGLAVMALAAVGAEEKGDRSGR